jgi:hypothetical protein
MDDEAVKGRFNAEGPFDPELPGAPTPGDDRGWSSAIRGMLARNPPAFTTTLRAATISSIVSGHVAATD